ncbi:hypothetical protein FKM82_021574 [Ascaphus truei]
MSSSAVVQGWSQENGQCWRAADGQEVAEVEFQRRILSSSRIGTQERRQREVKAQGKAEMWKCKVTIELCSAKCGGESRN